MSKIAIGVGDDFPLDEGLDDHPRRGPRGRHGFRHRHHHHGHDHGHHHGHGHHRHGLHLPLIAIVATVAALIGAGKFPHLATEVILTVAGLLVILAMAARLWRHLRHRKEG